MFSYYANADINTNPNEPELDRLINLDMEGDFIVKAALRRIQEQGIARVDHRMRAPERAKQHILEHPEP